MLSNYFLCKTKKIEFIDGVKEIIGKLFDKKVLVYGAGEGFLELNKQYNFIENLNIIAIVDKKFKKNNNDSFLGLKAISPEEIKNNEYDCILVSNENYKPIKKYLLEDLCLDENIILTLFNEKIIEERENINFLYKHKFDKTYEKLAKKMKNQSIVLYGAGVLLEVIQEYFDLKKLNIIAVADKKYEIYKNEKTFLGYKTIAPSEIKELNPKYLLISTKYYINIFEYLTDELLKNTKINVKPLVKKSFVTLIKEVCGIL